MASIQAKAYRGNMKIAIVGAAPSAKLVKDTPADEIWTMNHIAMLAEEQHERFPFTPSLLLEIHNEKEIRELALGDRGDDYWRWLKKKHDFPILMKKKMLFIPSSETYPLDKVKTLLDDKIFVSGEMKDEMFGSSADYLTALAIYYMVTDIYYYGTTFGLATEYKYQNSGFHFWTGLAVGKGINIHVCKGDSLFEQKSYGYHAWVRITRSRMRKDLRILKDRARKKGDDALRCMGAVTVLKQWIDTIGDKSIGREAMERAAMNYRVEHAGTIALYNKDRTVENYNRIMFMEGAVRLVENYIGVCDLYPSNLEFKPVVEFMEEK